MISCLNLVFNMAPSSLPIVVLFFFLALLLSSCSHSERIQNSEYYLEVSASEFVGSVKSTIDVVEQVVSLLSQFGSGFGDFRLSNAIADCLDLLDLSAEELTRTLSVSQNPTLRELMAVPVQLRILAVTATPGSKQQTIQQIIDNLQISTLEYRNESDHDVSPYVHDKKIELIEVAMGQEAVEINNMLLEVICPFVARLCATGVLVNRDLQTLRPCDLLNFRDKFCQAPPLDLPLAKHGEVEGYFGVLIALYHIQKLLSSHCIRPVYEMLEEKLQKGSFA